VVTKAGFGTAVGTRVGLKLGVGKFVGMGLAVVKGEVGTAVGEGKLVGLGLVVTVAAGVGEVVGETWAGFWVQPTPTITISVTNHRAKSALKILQTLIGYASRHWSR